MLYAIYSSQIIVVIFVQDTILMEPTMKGAVSRMSVNSMSGIDLMLPVELRNIQEFFLLMTICNTVVVSAHNTDNVSNLKNTKFLIAGRDDVLF